MAEAGPQWPLPAGSGRAAAQGLLNAAQWGSFGDFHGWLKHTIHAVLIQVVSLRDTQADNLNFKPASEPFIMIQLEVSMTPNTTLIHEYVRVTSMHVKHTDMHNSYLAFFSQK